MELEILKTLDAAIIQLDQSEKPPEILYHFTDIEALMAITSTRSLRATLAFALNDSSEVRYGEQLAREILSERLRQRADTFDAALLDYLDRSTGTSPSTKFDNTLFVVSFCEREDKSGQWLHYGRAGRGVALGFLPKLAELTEYKLVKVNYDPDSQRQMMISLIESGRDYAQKDGRLDVERSAALFSSLYVPWLAVRMKHPSFREEQEWRLTAHTVTFRGRRTDGSAGEKRVNFRRSGEQLIPYEDIPLVIEVCLAKVVLGHSAPTTPEAVRVLLAASGYYALVTRSNVPVR